MSYICLLIGYICGSFLTAEVVARANGKDVRLIDPTTKDHGNPGTTNVLLNISTKQGIIVFIGDILKTVIACCVAYVIYKDPVVYLYTGYGCLLGHDYSFLYKFDGGKGVTVTIVWIAFIMPKYAWLIFLGLAIITLISGYLNLCGILLPIIATPVAWITLYPTAGLLMLLASIITIVRNRRDLYKIFTGQYKPTYLLQRIFKK